MNNIKQVGGTHYQKLKIQPIELFVRLNLNWFQAEIIKYLSRYPNKGLELDLKKARNVTMMAIEFFGDTFDLDYDNIPLVDKYTDQFRDYGNFFNEPVSFSLLRGAIYSVINKQYSEAKHFIELLLYAEYEVKAEDI